MASNDFNIQQALEAMEGRIREDIKQAALVAAQAKNDAIALSGRVTNLEEKAGWIGAGFGAMVIGGMGFVWHVVTSWRTFRP